MWSLAIPILAALCQITLSAAEDILPGTLTVIDLEEWGYLRYCEQRILAENDWLLAGLDCPAPYYNHCYCNTNQKSLATSYMSSCVFSYCSHSSADFTSVASVYDKYCSAQWQALGVEGVVTDGGSLPTTDPNAPAVPPGQPTGKSESQSSSSSSGLSTGAIVGIVVSVVCSVLGLIFGIGFKVWQYRRDKLREKQGNTM